jgi:hypothetical protein
MSAQHDRSLASFYYHALMWLLSRRLGGGTDLTFGVAMHATILWQILPLLEQIHTVLPGLTCNG